MGASSSLSRVVAMVGALSAAEVSGACQRDSNAGFDDSALPTLDSGRSGGGVSGQAAGGTESAGRAAGGNQSKGDHHDDAPGEAGEASGGDRGKAGADAGGSADRAGSGAGGTSGASGGGGSGGSAGSVERPPVTLEITKIDDTTVGSCYPNLNFGEKDSLNVDGNVCVFESLLNPSLADIPAGAEIRKAKLALACTNDGDAITVSYVEETWSEQMVRWNNRPSTGKTLNTFSCDKLGEVSIDLTNAVKAWLKGEHAAFGIYLTMQGNNGSDFGSSEAANPSLRPSLSVTYTPP